MAIVNGGIPANRHTLLNGVVATGAGTPVHGGGKKSFHIEGITTATVKLQASNDRANWFDLATATSDAMYADDTPYNYIRANVTAWTSGTIYVYMAVE